MNNLKKILKKIDTSISAGDFKYSEKKLVELLRKNPDNHGLHSRLGTIYNLKGEFETAKQYHQKAFESVPDNIDYRFNFAVCEDHTGYSDHAREILEKSIELKRDDYISINYLGVILMDLKEDDKALELFERAIKLEPNEPKAHINISGILKKKGLIGEAVKHLEKALSSPFDKSIVYNNLGNSYLTAGNYQRAEKIYRKALEENPRNIMAINNLLLGSHYDSRYSPEEIFRLHREWGKKIESLSVKTEIITPLHLRNRRIRVGYLSADLRKHSVGYFMMPIIEEHDPNEVEVFIYYNYRIVDSMSMEFLNLVNAGWRDISTLSDTETIKLIVEDRIDILVDLSGHTAHSRLPVFASKPAPIQITYLGYPDTTGVKSIDYRLTDGFADPPGKSEEFNLEKLIRIPGCFLCYKPNFDENFTINKKRTKHTGITFGSFNLSSKINDRVIKVWSEVLRRTPDSSLLLKSTGLDDPYVSDNFKARFNKEGIDEQRLIFKGFAPTTKDHLNLYNQMDIALDPFPYNGTTTTLEAIYMGCPVVTLKGDRHSARVGYSIMKNIGLSELIAESEDSYIDKAVMLASDKLQLAKWTKELRKRLESSILMDRQGFVRKLERVYREVWSSYCEDNIEEVPAKIAVKNGLKIVVPDSLNLMTPFVLREQEDWFENEITFTRDYIKPGMNILDIGANYGLYTLNFAKSTGGKGKVLSFEPSSGTAAYLKMSIKENDCDNVKVFEAGLSRERGSAMFTIHPNSEINSIVYNHINYKGIAEHICLLKLDEVVEKSELNNIDFLKLDAEGEEGNILAGGRDTFLKYSPLVMYELTHGEGHNMELVIQFRELGYKSYYLIPGLQILVPFNESVPADRYLLNLFACKDDLAETLEIQGILCRSAKYDPEIFLDDADREKYWQSMPCRQSLINLWTNKSSADEYTTQHESAIDDFIVACDNSKSASVRVGFLAESFKKLKKLGEVQATIPRLFSLARVAAELGERDYAVRILKILYSQFNSNQQININEAHLALSERYDKASPGSRVGEWYLSSIAEQLVRLIWFSCYFDQKNSSLEYLQVLKELGFQSEEMERRRQLIMIRNGELIKPVKSEILKRKSDVNLNPEWWSSQH